MNEKEIYEGIMLAFEIAWWCSLLLNTLLFLAIVHRIKDKWLSLGVALVQVVIGVILYGVLINEWIPWGKPLDLSLPFNLGAGFLFASPWVIMGVLGLLVWGISYAAKNLGEKEK